MNDSSRAESVRAAGEAQDAIVSRPRGSKSGAIAAAMRRYLSAETYDEHRRSRADRVTGKDTQEKSE